MHGALAFPGGLSFTGRAAPGEGGGGGPAFQDLTLDNDTVAEDAAVETVVGQVVGFLGAPYVVAMIDQAETNWFFLDGPVMVDTGGLDFETNASPTITLREYHEEDSGYNPFSPVGPYHDTVITIHVTDVSEGAVNLYPDPDLGDGSGSYTQAGGSGSYSFYANDGIACNDATGGRAFVQTGSLLTAVQAAFEPDTDYFVRLTCAFNYTYGDMEIRIGDGDWSRFYIDAMDTFEAVVRSGATINGVWLRVSAASGGYSNMWLDGLEIFEATLGNNIVTGGDFASSSGWSSSGSAEPPVIGGGVCTGGGSDDGNVHRDANETITAGRYVARSRFVSGTYGDIRRGVGANANGRVIEAATLTVGGLISEIIDLASVTNQRVQMNLNATDAAVDDFEVRRIIGP